LWQRAALIVAGLLLIDPGFVTDVIGAALAFVVVGSQWYERRQAILGAKPTPAKQTS
jgi:UPF0716 family protein affecting phage T7 exclusion